MQKCKYCGKEYKLNENMPEFLPEIFKEKIKYIPSCKCHEIQMQKEYEEMEKKLEKERLQNKIKKYKDISVIDRKLLNANFITAEQDKHIRLCQKYAEKFVKIGTAPQGLLLHGSVGTGKTFASACISNYLMENGKTVLVMNLGLYLIKLKKEWDEAESNVLEYVNHCDLLVIDDFGVEKVTEFVLDKAFALIDTRYRAEKPLIITTNLSLKEITNKFGSRISDRLQEMCYPLRVEGQSKRLNRKRDEFLEFIA